MKVDGNKRIVTEKKVAITTNKTEYVRYEVSSSVVTDYRATDGYKDMALRSATGGRVVGGVEWDAGSAPAAFYAPKKKSAFSRGLYAFAKRAFDIVSSLVFLVAFSWLYLILALVVKLGDGGKVFYFHERVGKNGKTIRIPKFRTMKKNAENEAYLLDYLTIMGRAEEDVTRIQGMLEKDRRLLFSAFFLLGAVLILLVMATIFLPGMAIKTERGFFAWILLVPASLLPPSVLLTSHVRLKGIAHA